MDYFISDDYTIYNSLPCGAVIFNISENYDIVYSNDIYNKTFESDFINVHNDDRQAVVKALEAEKMPTRISLRCAGKNGKYTYVQMFVVRVGERALALVFDDTDNIVAIQKLRTEEQKLREKAFIDPLSKVYNRATAVEKINKRLAELDTYDECALIVLDIDNFKKLNDNFGHLYGDAVITMAAGSIKSVLDDDDILGRFGGDEFFIFVSDKRREELDSKLESIRLAILKMRLDKNDENDISCSMGVSFGCAGMTYEEMFRQADSALYMAKSNGKNRFEYFNGQYSDKISLSYSGHNGEIQDENDSNEEYDITTVALEIASKSTSTENAVSNLMRHIGVVTNLDCIQVMKFDTLEDKVYLEFQWWKEHNGLYNVVMTEAKSGYYVHNDLMLFRNRFHNEKIFHYTTDFKEGFSQKYKDVFDKAVFPNMLFSSNNENEDIFYVVTYQTTNMKRVWERDEMNDMAEITKIISMFMKSYRITTEREKLLEDRVNHSRFNLYSVNKFYEEAGRINREAISRNEKIAMANFDIKHLYRFSRTYGIKEGDRVMEAFAEFLLKADSTRAITCYLSGTDNFITLFRYNPECDVRTEIEKEITRFCADIGDYREFPLIIKAGLCLFEPGQPIARAMDIAKELKHGIEINECMCISRKMLPSEAII